MKDVSVTIQDGQESDYFFISPYGNKSVTVEHRGFSNAGTQASGMSTSGTRPQTGTIIAIVAVAVIFFFLYAHIMLGRESTTRTVSASAQSTQVVKTDEELASEKLQDASAKFDNGKYLAAIELCDTIVADYPDTETAASVPDFLQSKYDALTHITATELWNAYSENVVNADKEYTDTVLIVSGRVSSIDKTNNGSNLAVILETGSIFYGVQLNFDKDQTDAVAELREGDNITVIGECTGQNGKVLVVFDGQNVMISDCYIIG